MDEKFANIAFEFSDKRAEFEDELCTVTGGKWSDIFWDSYDASLEFKDVDNDYRLSAEAQKFIYDHGFVRCWLNHGDKWETYYGWGEDIYKRCGKHDKSGFVPLQGIRTDKGDRK